MTEEKKKAGRPKDTWWDKRLKAYKNAEGEAAEKRLAELEANKQANMIPLDYEIMNG